MNNLDFPTLTSRTNGFPDSIASRTRRVYDTVAAVYPLSTFFFHSRAHRCALELAGVRNGMRVLEVATGSGEMFHRLVRVNRGGHTVGLDLSPNMAARTQRRVRKDFPDASTCCQAVDARFLPFREDSFDVLVCCYLLELLDTEEDIRATLAEFRRVLRHRGTLCLVCIGQSIALFNGVYKLLGGMVPAFWGRQVERKVPQMIESSEFRIVGERLVRQSGYPSRILAARK